MPNLTYHKKFLLSLIVLVVLLACLPFGMPALRKGLIEILVPASTSAVSAPSNLEFREDFETTTTVQETNNPNSSSHSQWWLNSGAYLFYRDGYGATVQRSLPLLNRWRLAYKLTSPTDSDNGYHLQNLFRLLTRNRWEDSRQEVYFKVTRDNQSVSYNHNTSNGIVLFTRYLDHDNLYYAGLRVDGMAIIKKKTDGQYCTLTDAPIFPIPSPGQSMSAIPKNQWIGLRTETQTLNDGRVHITLSIDTKRKGHWEEILSAIDDGTDCTGPPHRNGLAGIRTDFMDVLFDDYKITRL